MSLSFYKTILLAVVAFTSPLAAQAGAPPCYKNIEANFFRPEHVSEALSLHSVSQSNWSLINAELQQQMKRVPNMVRERADRMDPNPFGAPFQPQAAVEILRQVLLEVFSGTLALFNINNQQKIEEMFQYIRQRQGQRMLACFGQEVEQNDK